MEREKAKQEGVIEKMKKDLNIEDDSDATEMKKQKQEENEKLKNEVEKKINRIEKEIGIE